MEFQEFNKIARLSREICITEKIDGTNALIAISEDGTIQAGSRTRWLTTETGHLCEDNYGFGRWVLEHKDELMALGPGYHYGEWWGQGIQRRYDLKEKRFSLFNVHRWHSEWNDRELITYGVDYSTVCTEVPVCHVVPVMYRGNFNTDVIQGYVDYLGMMGSVAAPGFMNPEGIVIYHTASGTLFKKTILKDEQPKSLVNS